MVEGRDERIQRVAEAFCRKRYGGLLTGLMEPWTQQDREDATIAVDALTSDFERLEHFVMFGVDMENVYNRLAKAEADFERLELLEKQSAQMHRYFEQRFHEVSARLAKAEAVVEAGRTLAGVVPRGYYDGATELHDALAEYDSLRKGSSS